MNARRLSSLAVAVMLALGGAAWARDSGTEFAVFGSYLDSDTFDEGVGGGAKLEFNPIDWLSVDARVSWITFSSPSVDMIPLEMAFLVNLPLANEQIVPYAGVGAGYYIFNADGFEVDDDVGFFPVAGLEFGTGDVSFLVEARWLFLQPDLSGATGALANLSEADLDGVGVNAGLLFRL